MTKAVRVVLLLMLALLLPLRGAVAASMACALPSPVMAHADCADQARAPDASTDADAGAMKHAAHGSADQCPLCMAAGSVAALAMPTLALLPAMPSATLRYPPLAEAVSGVVPDSPERPPRAI